MIDYIKHQFLEDPEKLKEFLELFEYQHVKIHHNKYISFGRDEKSSPKSIVVYVKNNDALLVKDWAHNQVCDIFNYIIKNRSISFKEVITSAKNILCIDEYVYAKHSLKSIFGGVFDKIKNRKRDCVNIYDESILDSYDICGNYRFLHDGISLETQKKFNIGFDIESQSITIPIYDDIGNLIAVKARINRDPEDNESKYFYLYQGMMSQTLYGYFQNYEYLESADEIIVFESEKSVLQCCTFHVYNVLAMGSSSLSRKQAQMLLSLNPKKIILAHDKNISYEVIQRNAKILIMYGKMRESEIYYTYLEDDNSIPNKSSPSDNGEEKYKEIMKKRLVKYVE